MGGELVDVRVEGGNTTVVGGNGVGGQTAAVEEDERVAGADAAEIYVGIVAAGVGAAVLGFVERDVGHLRESGQQLDRREGIAGFDLLPVENGDRKDSFLGEALDVGARDREGFEFEDLFLPVFPLGRGGSGSGSGRDLRNEDCRAECRQ